MAIISIYRRIAFKTGKKGWLPDNYSLSEGSGNPGEADAELLYNTDMEAISNLVFDQFIEMLRNACEDPKSQNDKKIIIYLEKNHILKLIDRLSWEIHNERRRIDIIALLDAAYRWAATSDDVNLVKLGISLMGMLNLDDWEEYRKVIVTLGKYEEFTLYSLYAASEWNDADKIISDYAKNLKGWGKMHAELWGEIVW